MFSLLLKDLISDFILIASFTDIPSKSWEHVAHDRTEWRCLPSQESLWSWKKAQKAQSAQNQSQWIIVRVVTLRIDMLYLQQF